MIVKLNPSPAELSTIARMHASSLPKSLITRVGQNYVEQFYRFVAKSESESVFVACLHGEVVGGALLSTARTTLSQRALIGTGLAWRLLFTPRLAFERVGEILSKPYSSDHKGLTTNAELFAIFVDQSFRSQGIGRKLLEAVEAELQHRGLHDYLVRTMDEANNRAISFYMRAGFEEVGSIHIHGNRFRLLRKHL